MNERDISQIGYQAGTTFDKLIAQHQREQTQQQGQAIEPKRFKQQSLTA